LVVSSALQPQECPPDQAVGLSLTGSGGRELLRAGVRGCGTSGKHRMCPVLEKFCFRVSQAHQAAFLQQKIWSYMWSRGSGSLVGCCPGALCSGSNQEVYTFFFFWIFFIYISNVIPFPNFPTSPLLYRCSPPQPLPLPTPPTPHSPTLRGPALAEPRASPSIGAQQGHPWLHMLLEPWINPCSGLFPRNLAWLSLLFLLGCKPLQLFQSFL